MRLPHQAVAVHTSFEEGQDFREEQGLSGTYTNSIAMHLGQVKSLSSAPRRVKPTVLLVSSADRPTSGTTLLSSNVLQVSVHAFRGQLYACSPHAGVEMGQTFNVAFEVTTFPERPEPKHVAGHCDLLTVSCQIMRFVQYAMCTEIESVEGFSLAQFITSNARQEAREPF
jgi:hypothetical protein